MKIKCPDDELLADYLEGRLSETDRFRVEAHLADCDACLDRFASAGSLLHSGCQLDYDAVPEQVTEAAVRLAKDENLLTTSVTPSKNVKDKVRGVMDTVSEFLSFSPWSTWQLQPVRSRKEETDEGVVVLEKTFRQFKVKIEVEKTGPDRCTVGIAFPEHVKPVGGVRVTLKQGNREVASYLTHKSSLVFEDLIFDRYSLVFMKKGEAIGSFSFEVTESGCGERQS